MAKKIGRERKDLSPDFFPIVPWAYQAEREKSHLNKASGLKSIAECNFTVAGFVGFKDLPLCEKLGLVAIFFGDDPSETRQWRNLSDGEIEKRIRKMVEKSGNSKAIIGYFITDEPGASDFPALAKAVAAVKRFAPGKLAYINLFPNYATIGAENISQLGTNSYTEYLERFVNEVQPQVISYDNYMVQSSMDLKNNMSAPSYYTNLMEIRRVALKHNLPFWNIVSSNQIRPETTIPSPANLSFQAYTTIAAGGRGVCWYTYYSRNYGYSPIDEFENKTLTWRYLQEVNRQIAVLGPTMNRLTSTGVYFTPPVPVESLPLLPGKLVSEATAETPMMVGEFVSSRGENYVMAVNLSLEKSAKFTLKVKMPQAKMLVVSAEDGRLIPMDNEKGLWLVAGQGVLIKF